MWPDGAKPDGRYCGAAPIRARASYCQVHHQRCWVAVDVEMNRRGFIGATAASTRPASRGFTQDPLDAIKVR